ncbi:hypothetical protein [Campylobacter troglodytis]|uniref:hypothetical protein n=1 Tax=Campylobacter troglodytis TaxID=654363 RepID=UPI00115BF4DA|nr:hypothetical protein [Campylobacter troglodytis]TQR60839.1 hypothetical protein DMC01_03710 [Campylobacter troglodytis]
MSCEIEDDEGYFGAKIVRGKREGVRLKKHLCFYFVLHARPFAIRNAKTQDSVYTQIVKHYLTKELLPRTLQIP